MSNRKSIKLLLSLAVPGLLLFAAGVSLGRAQSAPSTPAGSRLYNPAHEISVTGSVSSVTHAVGRRGWDGTHLQFSTATGMLEVHVGPTWFLEAKKFPLAAGDSLEITGSRVETDGQPILLARTIVKNGSTLTLRNERGFPVWSQRRGF